MTLAAAAALAVSCTAPGTTEGESGSDRATTSTRAPATTTTTAAPPPPYELPADEVEPDLKLAAARFVEALLTYDPSPDPAGDAARRLEAGGFDPAVVAATAPLLVPEARSEAKVVYPQLGGLQPRAASVMVVVEHRLAPAGCCPSATTRTLDVRMARPDAAWRVVGVESIGGQPPPPMPEEGFELERQVLDASALVMPDSARWDVEAGLIVDELLLLLLDIVAAGHSMEVTSFVSGHPVNVFGRPHLSNHARGRAIDVWAVDGQRVTGAPPGSGAYRVVERALAFGATEVGAPWDLDGPGGSSFADAVHADHLHLAFDP